MPASKITWEGVLAVEGALTSRGDDRFIVPGALSWDNLTFPIPFRFVRTDVGRHDQAVTVGTIEQIWREDAPGDSGVVHVKARGTYDHFADEGLEAARLAHSNIQPGISIDPDDVTAELAVRRGDGTFLSADEIAALTPDDITPDMAPVNVWTTARLRSATQVAIPAFSDARVTSVTIPDDLTSLFPEGSLTAAALDFSDSAMVALTPAAPDAERLTHPDGQPADDLHVTLLFLGDASAYDESARDAVTAALEAAFDSAPADTADAWAAANFNPDTDKPAAVYLIGRNPEIVDIRTTAVEVVSAALAESAVDAIPEQHVPWIPHLTVGYGLDPAVLTEFGPITFDAITVSFGDDDRTIPLSGSSSDDEVDEDPEPDPDPDPDELAARVFSGGWCAPSSLGELGPIADIERARKVNTPGNVSAAAVPPHTTAVEDDRDEGDWNGDDVEKALPTGEDPDFYARFYAYQSDKGDGTAKDHWHYLHHYVAGSGSDIEVGDASIIACRAIIQLLNGARGVDIVARGEDRQTVYDHIAKHMRDGGYEDIPELIQNTTSSAAPEQEDAMSEPDSNCDRIDTLIASSAPVDIPTVPKDHFTPFDLTEPTPLTLTESGHVFGHIALNNICHVGHRNCVPMPRSASGLRYFHTGLVRLDDGSDLPTGRITMKGGHADINANWRKAMAHYDDTSTAIADVVAVEDDHGIAVFGHIRPGTSPEDVHAFRASTPSGDWRAIGTSAELINIHMVNSPGFPVYRVADGQQQAAIVASSFPVRTDAPSTLPPVPSLSADDLAVIVSDAVARETEAARLHDAISPSLEAAATRLASKILRS